jgi:hypothetical protein
MSVINSHWHILGKLLIFLKVPFPVRGKKECGRGDFHSISSSGYPYVGLGLPACMDELGIENVVCLDVAGSAAAAMADQISALEIWVSAAAPIVPEIRRIACKAAEWGHVSGISALRPGRGDQCLTTSEVRGCEPDP